MLSDRPELGPVALLLYAASGIVILGTAAMSPVLPAIRADLGLTESQVGLVMSAFTLPVVFAVPVLGWLADWIGRRPVLTGGLLLFGLSGMAVYFVAEFRHVLALRVLQGVGFSAVLPLIVAIIGDLFEGGDEVGAQGLRVTSINLGGFLFPVATGALAEVAWNVPFLLFGAAIPAGLAVLRWLPEPARGTDRPERYVRAVLAAVRSPPVAVAVGVGFVRFFTLYGLYAFLPLIAVERGLTAGQAGAVVGAISGGKLVVATQARRSLLLGSPRITVVVALLFGGVAVAGLALPATFPAFLGVAAAFGAIEGISAPLQKTVLTRFAARNVRAGVVSFNAAVQNAGKTIAPVAVGAVVSAWALPAAFPAVGTGTALAAVGLFAVLYAADVPEPAEGEAALD